MDFIPLSYNLEILNDFKHENSISFQLDRYVVVQEGFLEPIQLNIDDILQFDDHVQVGWNRVKIH